MATERIDIVVSERGSRTVRRNLDDIGKSAQGAQGAVQLLRRVLGTLAVGAAVQQLVSLLDTFTNLQNRIRTVTTSAAQLAVVTDELFNIANRTRSAFESTAELYARLALAAKDLGVSQQEVLNFTESLNQAVILSGASAVEAQAGIIQLAQGLASGTLRGDELRSVLEQLPAVADVIAKSMGITRGELRKMGEEGKITADIVLKAFRDARTELAERFAKTVPTIGQSFTVLRNKIIEFLGSLDSATGATAIISRALLTVAENIDLVARSFGAAAIVIGVIFAQRAVGAAITAVRALTVAIAANPIGAIALLVLSAAAALTAFSDQIKIADSGLATLADVGVAAFQEIRDAVSGLSDFFASAFGVIGDLIRRVFGDVDLSIAGILRGAASVVDRVVGLFVGAFKAITGAFGLLPSAFSDIFTRAVNGAVSIVESGINKIIGAINTVTNFVGAGSIEEVALGRLVNDAEGASGRLGAAVRDGFVEGFNTSVATDTVNRIIDNAEKRAKDRLAAAAAAQAERDAARAGLSTAGTKTPIRDREFEKLLKELRDERDLLTLSNRERQIQQGLLQAERTLKRELTRTEKELVEGLLREVQALEDLNIIKDVIADLEREHEILTVSNREREIRGALLQVEAQLGRELTDAEQSQLEALLRRNQARREENDLLRQIRGPQEDYTQTVETLNRLLAAGRINQEEYNRTLRDARIGFLETQTTVGAGFERGFLKAQVAMEDFATQSEILITDAFTDAKDVVVDFFETGTFQADKFFQNLASNFIKLGTQQAFAALSGPQGLGGLLGGGSSGGGGLASLFGGGGGLGGGIGGLFSGLFGFANGGSFEVGANTSVGNLAGIDNRVVAFRARDGETVHVDPPGSSGRAVNVVYNITTPDADSFRRSEGQITARTAAVLQRSSARNN